MGKGKPHLSYPLCNWPRPNWAQHVRGPTLGGPNWPQQPSGGQLLEQEGTDMRQCHKSIHTARFIMHRRHFCRKAGGGANWAQHVRGPIS